MIIENVVLNEKRNVTLQAYVQGCGAEFPQYNKRPGLLIIPGGGYGFCSEREADPVAFPFMAAGFQVFILRYSLNEDSIWPNPLEDYDVAMDFIKTKSEEWMVETDRIAIIGFSAGGHLAAAASTMAKNRPAATILGYPLTTDDTKWWNKSAPEVVSRVDEKTPPCFIFATRTDNVVPVRNSMEFATALEKAGIMYELHVYSYGKHGLSTHESSVRYDFLDYTERVKNWVPEAIGFLKEVLGDFGPDGLGAPLYGRNFSFPYPEN